MFFKRKKSNALNNQEAVEKFIAYIKKTYDFDNIDIIELDSITAINHLSVQAAIDNIFQLSDDNSTPFNLGQIERCYYNLVNRYKQPRIMILTRHYHHYNETSYIFFYKTHDSFIMPVKFLNRSKIFGTHSLGDDHISYRFTQVAYFQFVIDNYIESIDEGLYFNLNYNPEFPIISINEHNKIIDYFDSVNYAVDILIRSGHGKKSDGTLFNGLNIELWHKDILLKSDTSILQSHDKYLVTLLNDFLFPLNFTQDDYKTFDIKPSLTGDFINNIPPELYTIKQMLDI